MKRLISIFTFKCPRCLKGEFLVSRNFYNLNKAGEVKECCSNCELKYTKETGFYYGAMYVSYGLSMALIISIFVALTVLYPNYSMGLLFTLIGLSVLIMTPILYALSKIIWINLFVKYDEKYVHHKHKITK
jgi:hypothetical protein